MDYFMLNLYFFATWIFIAVGVIAIIIKLPTDGDTKNESKVLNIPRVSKRSEQLLCDDCGGKIDDLDAYCKHCGEVIP